MPMEITRAGFLSTAAAAPGKNPAPVSPEQPNAPSVPRTDRVEISAEGRAALLRGQTAASDNTDAPQAETAPAEEAAPTEDPTSTEEEKKADAPEETSPDEASQRTTVAFNAEKRARQLAAARTPDEVRQVLALLSEDLEDCRNGLENGWCDENEVARVEAMIRQAEGKLAQVAGNEDEEQPGLSAFELAGLM